ncbi:MAG: amylo-alpha-1,6-glucosidase [Nitrososphaerales archaeon]
MTLSYDLTFDYDPIENPDWGFARTNRFILRNSLAEFGLSAYSVFIDLSFPSKQLHLTAPNRDYSYEGLLALTGGENWKFLDCFAFVIIKKGVALKLHPKKVSASTWFLDYLYDMKDKDEHQGLLKTSYWLSEDEHACLSLDFKIDSPKKDFELMVAPFLDIRHIYSESEPEKHIIKIMKNKDNYPMIHAEKGKRLLIIFTPYKNVQIEEGKAYLNWFYKLGDGFRVQAPQGIIFRGQSRELLVPALFHVKFPKDSMKIKFYAIPMMKDDTLRVNSIQEFKDKSEIESNKLSFLKSVIKKGDDLQIYNSILLRIDAFTRFGMKIILPKRGELKVPEAGGWWFRSPWMRDIYTNLYQNLELLRILDKRLETVRDSILLGIEFFDDKTGRVHNHLPMLASDYEVRNDRLLPLEEYYSAVDPTLLFFIISWEYVKLTGERGLLKTIIRLFARTFQIYQKASLNAINGPPVISDLGLLACVPWHSWTDSKRMTVHRGLRIDGLPTRIPKEWQIEEIENSKDPEEVKRIFNTPRFYLPEINALWIKALEAVIIMNKIEKSIEDSGLLESIKDTLSMARINYLPTFWNSKKGYFYDVLSYDLSKKDETLGSSSVVAASILQDLMPKEKLESMWEVIQKRLLVYRRTKWLKKYYDELYPFGIIVKDAEERIYFDDEQYHGAVVWPRDTPYVIKLLERIEKYDVIKGFLISNLDHQMSEGTIFYNHELFSLPLGKNPYSVNEFKDNPVPVKNPIQFWSQWVDPYLKHEI